MAKKIVVLGGGYAGILTAKNLARNFKNKNEIEIKLIDRNPFHTMLTELHEVAADRVDEDSIKISLKRVFAGRNVEVILDKICSIDYESKILSGENSTYSYDYLVIATGSKPTYFGTSGAEEFAFNLWSYEDAVKLKVHILDTFRKASKEPNDEKRRKMLTFFVVGAGFSGVEMVGELAEWVPILCEKFEIDFKDVKVVDVDVLDRPCPILTEKLSAKVKKRLEKMGVEVKLKSGVVALGKDNITIKTDDVDTIYDAHTVIWTAGVEGSSIAQDAGKVLKAAGRGRLQTDEYLRAENKEDVFVAGDNIFYIPEGEKMPVPQMVENCEASSHTVSENIISLIEGDELHKYKPKFHGMMVSVGGRYGVAYAGLPGKFMEMPSFIAMLSKHFINIIYFAQVLGWNKIYSYIWHEFFSIRHNRSFLGGHFSNKTPNFWLVPLRAFLGFTWFVQGVQKIKDGWLQEPKLENFFASADRFYQFLLDNVKDPATFTGNPYAGSTFDITTSASEMVEAVSAASAVNDVISSATVDMGQLVNTADQILFKADIFGLVNILVVNVGEVAARIKLSFVDWIINGIVLSGPDSQMFFQTSIVVIEILIGLALIGGLFTFLSSSASLALQIMFVTTTGLYMNTWWMIFAAIACLIGSGSVIGLDYYVIPWLKRFWKKIKFAQKWYFYND